MKTTAEASFFVVVVVMSKPLLFKHFSFQPTNEQLQKLDDTGLGMQNVLIIQLNMSTITI